MKSYISRNWQKLMIAIGSFFAICILIFKISAPKTLLADYIKYGKNITPAKNEIIDVAKDNVSSVWNSVDPELAKLAMILIAGITIVVFLSALASKAGENKSAKKK